MHKQNNKLQELLKSNNELVELLKELLNDYSDSALTGIAKEPMKEGWIHRIAELRGKYQAFETIKKLLGK